MSNPNPNPNLKRPSRRLTRLAIKREMWVRRGHTFASYARTVEKTDTAIRKVANGKLGGQLRQDFMTFFGFNEEEIPLRLKKRFYRQIRTQSEPLASVHITPDSVKQLHYSSTT